METMETQIFDGEPFHDGDALEFRNLHERKKVLTPPWLIDFQRAKDAAAQRERLEMPERLTKPQMASREMGGIGAELREWRDDAEKPRNMLEETAAESNDWLKEAA